MARRADRDCAVGAVRYDSLMAQAEETTNMTDRVNMAPAERMLPLIEAAGLLMARPPDGVRPANAEG